MRCVFEAMTDGSADYTHACAPTPSPTQLSQTLHDNQMLYLGHPGQNNSAAPNISCPEDSYIVPKLEEDDDWGTLIPTSVQKTMITTTARICYYGPKQESFCTTQGLPSKILEATWSASCLDFLIERIEFELHICDLVPLGMSYLFAQQRDSSRRTFYVKGRWRCCLLFEITVGKSFVLRSSQSLTSGFSRPYLKTQRDVMFKIFEEVSNGIAPTN